MSVVGSSILEQGRRFARPNGSWDVAATRVPYFKFVDVMGRASTLEYSVITPVDTRVSVNISSVCGVRVFQAH